MRRVKVLTVEDWREWREMRLKALADAPEAFASTLVEWSGIGDTEDRWRGRLESVALHALFFSEGEAVGMVSATEPRAGDVWLVSMWVDPVARGQGVGDLLIQFVVEWAQAWGACRVRLGVWDGNTAAIGLYERNGFVDGGASQQDGDVVERRMDLTLL